MSRPLMWLAALVLTVLAGSAAGQAGVALSPPRSQFTAAPGSVVTNTVRVDHPGSGPMSVTVVSSDILLLPDGSTTYLDAGAHARSIGPWLTVNPLQFELQGGTTVETRYTISVPPDAEPGTYWGVLFFESGPAAPAAEPAQGFGVRTLVRVGHVVYVDVGEVLRDGRINGIRYEPTTSPNRPAQIRIVFENSGNAVLRVDGTLEILDLDGTVVAEVPIDDAVSFPGFTHELVLELTEPLASGSYVVLALLDYGGDALVAGEGAISVP